MSLVLTEKTLDHGIAASIWRRHRTRHAPMERTAGTHNRELVNRHAIGRDSRQELDTATARWVARSSRERLHWGLGYRPPIEIENECVQGQRPQ